MPRPNVPEDAALIDEAAGSSRLLLPGTMDGPYAYANSTETLQSARPFYRIIKLLTLVTYKPFPAQ